MNWHILHGLPLAKFAQMNRSIAAFSFFTLAWALCAQCTVPVAVVNSVVSGSATDTISTVAVDFWVCSDASGQVFDGSNNSYLVEAGASITVIGHFSSIYYKGNTPLIVYGYQNYLTGEDSAAFFDGGTDNIIVECGAGNVIFNYDNAPSNGCSLVGIQKQPAVQFFSASPNPTNGLLQIGFTDAAARVLELRNPLGKIALSLPFQQQVDLGSLPAGTYSITIRDAAGRPLARALIMHT